MHPNAEIAQELNLCVKSQDDELAILGLRRGLVIREGESFKLTKKGLAFVEKWGGQAQARVRAKTPVTPVAIPTVPANRLQHPTIQSAVGTQRAYQTTFRSSNSSRQPSSQYRGRY